MTQQEFDLIMAPDTLSLIEHYATSDPHEIALKFKNPMAATLIRNLQNNRSKLPTYHSHRCIIPTLNGQQSSSETSATLRHSVHGDRAIDLTCGLGVDSFVLSQSFKQVTAIEIDPLICEITRHNFASLDCKNVDVICTSAEEYILESPEVDLIFIDPSRRSSDGKALYAISECHPNVMEILPMLMQKASTVMIKVSPLFDVEEIFRTFPQGTSCQVISINNECKEVVIIIKKRPDDSPKMTVTVSRNGIKSEYHFSRDQISDHYQSPDIKPNYLCVPDVGFYKTRTVSALVGVQEHNYTGGYVITSTPPTAFCGSIYKISEILPYRPREIRKRFPKAIVHQRNFRYTNSQIGITQGGSDHLFFTEYKDKLTLFIVENYL